MRRVLLVVLASQLAAAGGSALAAGPRFEHLTTDQGLPGASVRAVLEDRDGFLWFGTQNGLARYDGYGMQVHVPDPEDPHTVGSRFIVSLAQDDSGTIWIGSFANGLSSYDQDSGRFTRYPSGGALPDSLPGVEVDDILPTADGILLAIGGGGLYRFDGRAFSTVLPDTTAGGPGAAFSGSMRAVARDGQRLLVGSSGQGLAIRDGAGSWRVLGHDPRDPRSLPDNHVRDLVVDADGTVWVVTWGGLARLEEDDSFTVFRPRPDVPGAAENQFVCAAPDRRGRLWIGAQVGLFAFDPRTGTFTQYAHDPGDPFSPLDGSVLSLHCDRSDIVWAGSWLTGLNKFDPWSQKFSVVDDLPGPESYVPATFTAGLEDSRGGTWIATGTLTEGQSACVLHYREPGGTAYRRLRFPELPPGGVKWVNRIVEDSAGRIWLGSNLGVWRVARTGPPWSGVPACPTHPRRR